MLRRRILLAGLAAGGAAPVGRPDTLRYVSAGTVNTLDPVAAGATGEAIAFSTGIYDRLLRFGPNGPEGELADSLAVSPDGRTITFRLRPGARWHDGSPVTAEDVRWSFARAVAGPGLARAQLATGGLTAPEQMTVAGPDTLELRLARADRLALDNLCTPYAPMFNSALVRRHATDDDPWATDWLREHTAGGGAFALESFTPGTAVTLRRFDGWAGGKQPGFVRAALQTVADASLRAALLERGDADIATGLSPVELRRLEQVGGVKLVSTPVPTGFGALVFNTGQPPFDRAAVRRTLALAVPYEAILAAALGGRGDRLFGAEWSNGPPEPDFPQPLPLRTDEAAARAGLVAAGLGEGFETTLSYSVSRAGFGEPASALIQEAFARIGVRVRIQALPDPQMAEAVTARRLPMLLERSLALFPSTPYFFGVFLSGDTRWNLPGWHDGVVDGLLSEARDEPDAGRYDALSRRLVARLADQVPMAPIWRPLLDTGISRRVTGFAAGVLGYPDLRSPVRA